MKSMREAAAAPLKTFGGGGSLRYVRIYIVMVAVQPEHLKQENISSKVLGNRL